MINIVFLPQSLSQTIVSSDNNSTFVLSGRVSTFFQFVLNKDKYRQISCMNLQKCNAENENVGTSIFSFITPKTEILFDWYSTTDEGTYFLTQVKLDTYEFKLKQFSQTIADSWGSIEFGTVESVDQKLSFIGKVHGFTNVFEDSITYKQVFYNKLDTIVVSDNLLNELAKKISYGINPYFENFAPISFKPLVSKDYLPRINYLTPDNFYGLQFGLSYGIVNYDYPHNVTFIKTSSISSIDGIKHSSIGSSFSAIIDADWNISKNTKLEFAVSYVLLSNISKYANKSIKAGQSYSVAMAVNNNNSRFELGFTQNINAVKSKNYQGYCNPALNFNITGKGLCLDTYALNVGVGYDTKLWNVGLSALTGWAPKAINRQKLFESVYSRVYDTKPNDNQIIDVSIGDNILNRGLDFILIIQGSLGFILYDGVTIESNIAYLQEKTFNALEKNSDFVFKNTTSRFISFKETVLFRTGINISF